MIEEELYEHAIPGSEALQTLTRMEDTHLESLHEDMIFVSIEQLGDGPYAGMRKKMTYFPIPWRTFPLMTMKESFTLQKQGAFLFVDLDREICDLSLVGSNSHDKGGT